MGSEIEASQQGNADPWENFPALRLLLKDRVDHDSLFPTIQVRREFCEENESTPCANQTSIDFGPNEMQDGSIFEEFSQLWNEKGNPLGNKYDQLRQSWWLGNVPNMLTKTPDRPHIKHVIMAYGTDVSTEVGYVYRKTEMLVGNSTADNTATTKDLKEEELFDGVPSMIDVILEGPHGRLFS